MGSNNIVVTDWAVHLDEMDNEIYIHVRNTKENREKIMDCLMFHDKYYPDEKIKK